MFSSDATEYIDNFSNREAELKSHFALAKKLYKLTGFTYFPHVIKPYFIKKAADFEYLKKGDNHYNGDDVEFCDSFRKAGGYTISDDYSKALRIYHLSGVHKPYTLDSTGKRKKKTSREETVEGCFKILSYFLDDLKKKKLYDSTYIIIAADHGGVNLCENPLLLIKQPDQKGSYNTSHIPVSNFDLPICMSEFFGTKVDYGEFGSSLKDLYEGQERERHLFYNYKGNMHLQVNEYVTTGAADDPESIILYQEYQDNRNGDSAYEFGTKLLFDADGSANDYCVEGILGSQGWQSVMHGPVSIMKIPIREVPKGENIIITIGTGDELIKSEVLNYNVFINGVMVFQGNTDKKTLNRDIKISVPVDDVLSQGEKNIEIKWVFPDIDESEMEMDLMKRTITYPLRSICVDVE